MPWGEDSGVVGSEGRTQEQPKKGTLLAHSETRARESARAEGAQKMGPLPGATIFSLPFSEKLPPRASHAPGAAAQGHRAARS